MRLKVSNPQNKAIKLWLVSANISDGLEVMAPQQSPVGKSEESAVLLEVPSAPPKLIEFNISQFNYSLSLPVLLWPSH